MRWRAVDDDLEGEGYPADDTIRFDTEYDGYFLRVNEFAENEWTWVLMQDGQILRESDGSSSIPEDAMEAAEAALDRARVIARRPLVVPF